MKRLFLALLVLTAISCKENTQYKTDLNDPELYQGVMKQLTDVVVYDIFSPPVASRVYVYPNIAAFEVMVKKEPQRYESLAGQLSGLPSIPDPENEDDINYNLAALQAFYKVGKTLIFSEQKMEGFMQKTLEKLSENGLPGSVKNASIAYGDQVADHILSWADQDNYKQTRTYPKYTIREEDRYWKPTPPDYMEGIEPHWNKIRTLVLDSSNQFPPKEPLEISMEKDSEFYQELMEVYEFGRGFEEEHKEIAKFWDCNPYVSHHRGHAMFATKKITPGGHWMGITAIATRKSNSDFAETVHAYTRVSISLFDAFISCWDEKWKTIVVRPETLINQYIDEDWVPLLQTPPFPEYTSGHSVISRAAAITLTDIYGDDFSFDDTTEIEYGLPQRQFKSFLHASEEAAISRLYGGIHYMMAIENGVEQGEKVGKHIVKEIQTRKNPVAQNNKTP